MRNNKTFSDKDQLVSMKNVKEFTELSTHS
jgi:hypothetical protein